jgi:hypothetical protein
LETTFGTSHLRTLSTAPQMLKTASSDDDTGPYPSLIWASITWYVKKHIFMKTKVQYSQPWFINHYAHRLSRTTRFATLRTHWLLWTRLLSVGLKMFRILHKPRCQYPNRRLPE